LLEGGFGLIGGLLCLACMAGCGGMVVQGLRRLRRRTPTQDASEYPEEASRPI
jgi:hypothetical protein